VSPAEHVRAAPGGLLRGPLSGTVRRHWLFVLAMAGAVVVRAVTMLAFRPVLWFGGDSASYVATALRLMPDPSRLGGYGLLLWLLRPLHSFAAVAAVQHMAGLAMGVMIYLLARRYRLPAWAATLAAVPVLFDAYQLQLEHDVVPDVLFSFLAMLALTLVLWGAAPGREIPAVLPGGSRGPGRARWRGWAPAAAGLLLGLSVIVWPVGLALLLLLLAALAARRAGWTVLVAAALAGAAPVAGYAAWFDASYHQVTLTDSEGVFLWARTMTFADCAVIGPPAPERVLCPHMPPARRPASSEFIWQPWSPLLHMPGGRFGERTNRLALDFALRAIDAQPAGYVTAVLRDFALSFTWNRPDHPDPRTVSKYQFSNATTRWAPAGLHTTGGGRLSTDQLAYTGGRDPATRAVQPYASWMVSYQRDVYLRGTLLGLILLAGLTGTAVRLRRLRGARFPGGLPGAGRFGPAMLPWAFAMAGLLVPPAVADFDLRYVVPAVPAACLAAVLAFAPLAPGRRPAHRPAAGAPAAGWQAAGGSTAADPAAADPAAADPAAADPAAGDPAAGDQTTGNTVAGNRLRESQ